MDPAEQAHLEKKLVIAQQHVDEGERLIERQRKSIEERQRDGHDNALANDLLAELEEGQRVQIEHRDPDPPRACDCARRAIEHRPATLASQR